MSAASYKMTEMIPSTSAHLIDRGEDVIFELVWAQAAQAHYLWVRASEVIWSEYTRIISVLSDAK